MASEVLEKLKRQIIVANPWAEALKLETSAGQLKFLTVLHKILPYEELVKGFKHRTVEVSLAELKGLGWGKGEGRDFVYHIDRYLKNETKTVVILRNPKGLVDWLKKQLSSPLWQKQPEPQKASKVIEAFISELKEEGDDFILFTPLITVKRKGTTLRVELHKYFLALCLATKGYREYTSLLLPSTLSLRRKGSVRLYELARKWLSKGKFHLTRKETYLIFDVKVDQYRFGYLKKFYLLPALKEINEKTELNLSFGEIKEKNRVKGITFTVEEKSGVKSEGSSKIPKPNNEDAGIDEKKILNLLKKLATYIKKHTGYKQKESIILKMKEYLVDAKIPIEFLMFAYEKYGDLDLIDEVVDKLNQELIKNAYAYLRSYFLREFNTVPKVNHELYRISREVFSKRFLKQL